IFQSLEGHRDVAHQVRMSEIETDTDVVKVGRLNEVDQLFGRGQLIRDVFQQHSHSQRLGEGAKMLDGSHSRLELAVVEVFVRGAEVLYQKTEGDLFRNFESALDFIHGGDALGPVGGGDVDR